jgi:hypothetical protein
MEIGCGYFFTHSQLDKLSRVNAKNYNTDLALPFEIA